MSKIQKLLFKLLKANSDTNFTFSELVNLLNFLGFQFRVKGSHHIFWKEGIEEIINLQEDGGKAKAYQVKQARTILIKYKLINDEI